MIQFPLIASILVACIRLINSNEYGAYRGLALFEPITTDSFTTDIVKPGDGNYTENYTEVYENKRFISSDKGKRLTKKSDETRTLKNCLEQIANGIKREIITRDNSVFHNTNNKIVATEITSIPTSSTKVSELLGPQLIGDKSSPVIHIELSTSHKYHDEIVTTVESNKFRENKETGELQMSTSKKLPALSTSTTTRKPRLKRNEKVRTWNIRSTTHPAIETSVKIKNVRDDGLDTNKRAKFHDVLKLANESRPLITPEEPSSFGTIRYSRPVQKPTSATGSIRPLFTRPNNNNFIHKQFGFSTLFPSATTKMNILETSTVATLASLVIFNETERNGIIDKLAQEIPWPVKKEAIVEGDIILGGLMMVHEREDSITCGPVMPQGGIQALEAMLFTLDQLNFALEPLLPNITLGAHILDDCDKDTYGLEMAVDFIKG